MPLSKAEIIAEIQSKLEAALVDPNTQDRNYILDQLATLNQANPLVANGGASEIEVPLYAITGTLSINSSFNTTLLTFAVPAGRTVKIKSLNLICIQTGTSFKARSTLVVCSNITGGSPNFGVLPVANRNNITVPSSVTPAFYQSVSTPTLTETTQVISGVFTGDATNTVGNTVRSFEWDDRAGSFTVPAGRFVALKVVPIVPTTMAGTLLLDLVFTDQVN